MTTIIWGQALNITKPPKAITIVTHCPKPLPACPELCQLFFPSLVHTYMYTAIFLTTGLCIVYCSLPQCLTLMYPGWGEKSWVFCLLVTTRRLWGGTAVRGGTQIWVGQECAAWASKPLPIYRVFSLIFWWWGDSKFSVPVGPRRGLSRMGGLAKKSDWSQNCPLNAKLDQFLQF